MTAQSLAMASARNLDSESVHSSAGAALDAVNVFVNVSQHCVCEPGLCLPGVTAGWGAEMVKSARAIASGKQGLTSLSLEHIMLRSVVAFGRIEQIKESPSRLMTIGQQMVASPIVAASRGTGIM
jgi:hypothetical protein